MTCSNLGAASRYLGSASNTMLVGHALGKLTEAIYQVTSAAENHIRTFCIGHSLGAQVCGFAGKTKQLDVIIGLDPAGPVFDTNSDDQRLNRGDAKMVHVIHTNPGTFGIQKAVGDVDIYVNGQVDVGQSTQQPGCAALNPYCSHSRFIVELLEHVWKTGRQEQICKLRFKCKNEEEAMVGF